MTPAGPELSALLARLDDGLPPTERAAAEAACGRHYARSGHAEPALRHLLAARQSAAAQGDVAGAAALDVEAAEVCLHRGEAERAQAFLDRALAHAGAASRRRASIVLAELTLARGELGRADELFAAAAQGSAIDDEIARCLTGRALVAAGRADLAAGERLASEAARRARDARTAGRAAVAAAAVAWRGDDAAGAAEALRAAIATFADHELHRDLAEAHLRMGLLCGEVGERGADLHVALEPPAGHLARAQDLFRAIGNVGDLERVRAAFRRFGRRATDRVDELELGQLLDELRQQRQVVQEVAGRLDPRGELRGERESLDGALRELALAEERFVAAVHTVVVERESIRGLLDMTRTLATVDDYGALPDEIARLACQLTGGDRAVAYLTDGGRGAWAIDAAADRDAWAAAISAAATAGGAPRLYGGQVDRAQSRERRASPRLGRAMAAPLRVGGRVLGALWVDRSPSDGLFSPRDLDLIAVFAGQAATILDNARIAEALRLAARTTAATLEAIGDGVVSIDAGGAIRTRNASAARLLGEGGAQLLELLRQSLARGEELDGRPMQLAAGEFVCNTRIVRDDDGAAVGLVATFTEWKRATRLAQRIVGSTARYSLADIVGDAPPLRRTLALAAAAAGSDASLLITGESGTGKEVLAQAIHNAGPRAAGPFVAINCAAIPRDLLESELFGYEAGAFTGARKGGRPGKFELAEGGTLLLDEIGDMPLEMQAKLLRVLQERSSPRLGGSRETPLTCRVVATTNRDLAAFVGRGLFRQDLYFRLRVLHVELPPLRERPGDILLLAQHFLATSSARLGKRLLRLASEVADAFLRYPWPGNVRELEHIVESEVTLAPPDREVIAEIPAAIADHDVAAPVAPRWPSPPEGWPPWPPWMAMATWPAPPAPPSRPSHVSPPSGDGSEVKTLSDTERELLVAALTTHRGRIPAVARALGVSRGTIYNKMRKFNLEPEQFR